MTGTPEHRCWQGIIQRCTNEKLPGYPLYGGRGIRICPEWRHDFAAFFAHVGPRPSDQHSIDRIDVNGHYEPGNVRWADAKTQANNRRKPVKPIVVRETPKPSAKPPAPEKAKAKRKPAKKRRKVTMKPRARQD